MDSSKIKDLLLKSGIPLEVSVVDKIAKFNVDDCGEIEYERDGKIFSTDIHATKDFNIGNNFLLSTNFVIECKYKTRDHNWFFMKFPESDYSLRSDARNEVFDYLLRPLLIKIGYQFKEQHIGLKELRVSNLFKVKTANKGVDIVKNDFNHSIIREAVSQVVFASIVANNESVEENIHFISGLYANPDKEIEYKNPIATLTIPIIITTANLFRVRDNLSIEDIENENDILNLSEKEKGILLINSDYAKSAKFSKQLFEKSPISFNNELENWITNFQPPDFFRIDMLKYTHPGYIYIINYYHFEELFANCINQIDEACYNFSKTLNIS